MSTLLVQSCSKSKIEVSRPVNALELYSGYFFKIIKKSINDGTENADIDLCILSAKHGLVDPKDKIMTYNQKMTNSRAKELGPEVRETLRQRINDGEYDRVVINAGEVYRNAIEGFDDGLDVDTYLINGNGLGLKGRSLKLFLRGDESGIKRMN